MQLSVTMKVMSDFLFGASLPVHAWVSVGWGTATAQGRQNARDLTVRAHNVGRHSIHVHNSLKARR
jgi:hypothetical protein